jgi:hypothetical protein
MPSKLTAHKLTGPAKDAVCQLLAEHARVTEVQAAVKQEFGIEVSLPAIVWYRDSPKWSKIIEAKRQALDANLDRLPISSRYWRLKKRQELLDQARSGEKPDLGTARGILLDAAKELGQLKPDTTIGTQIGQVNIHLVQQVLALPEDAQEQYLRTGRLPPRSYLSDLALAEGEK